MIVVDFIQMRTPQNKWINTYNDFHELKLVQENLNISTVVYQFVDAFQSYN